MKKSGVIFWTITIPILLLLGVICKRAFDEVKSGLIIVFPAGEQKSSVAMPTMLTSWYEDCFGGSCETANGELFNPDGLTAAHKELPFNTSLLLTNPKNGLSARVRINDRGPFWENRELDISRGAAKALGIKKEGLAELEYSIIGQGPHEDSNHESDKSKIIIPPIPEAPKVSFAD